MPGYSTRTYTWQDLADDSVTWGDTNPWVEWTGNGTTIDGSTGYGNIVYTTTTKDFGEIKDFYMTASVISNGTNSIVVKVSNDDVSYTNVNPQTNPGDLKGRYVKLEVTVVNASTTATLTSIDASFLFDPISETFPALSIAASGNTTLPITQSYSRITSMTYDAPKDIQVVLTDTTASAPGVKAYDLDTWGKVETATTADVSIQGFPNMNVNANGNIEVN